MPRELLPEIVAIQQTLTVDEPCREPVLERLLDHVRRLTGATGASLELEELAVSIGEGSASTSKACVRRTGRKAGTLKAFSDRGGAFDADTAAALELVAELLGAALTRADLVSKLEHVAGTDDLTSLANRRRFDDELDRELARARRRRYPVALALLDLDRFKRFNDSQGHPGGDRLLISAARAWTAELRRSDLLARYGGDEFALLLPECEEDGAVVVVERLIAVTPLEETCSAGVAVWDGKESAAELLSRADVALYRAKRTGRDRVRLAQAA